MKKILEKIIKAKKLLEQQKNKILEQSFSSIGQKVLEAFRQDRKQMRFEHIPELLKELTGLDDILPKKRQKKK